jgi:hypothetical protein
MEAVIKYLRKVDPTAIKVAIESRLFHYHFPRILMLYYLYMDGKTLDNVV